MDSDYLLAQMVTAAATWSTSKAAWGTSIVTSLSELQCNMREQRNDLQHNIFLSWLQFLRLFSDNCLVLAELNLQFFINLNNSYRHFKEGMFSQVHLSND